MRTTCTMAGSEVVKLSNSKTNEVQAQEIAQKILLKSKTKAHSCSVVDIPFIVGFKYCRKCKKSVRNLKNHLQNKHNHGKIVCGHCYCTIKRVNLKRHTKRHHKNLPFKAAENCGDCCFYCGFQFDRNSDHQIPSQSNVHVVYCPKNLFNKETLQCCDKKFSNHHQRKLHIESIHRQTLDGFMSQLAAADDHQITEFLTGNISAADICLERELPPDDIDDGDIFKNIVMQVTEVGLKLAKAGLGFSVLEKVFRYIIDKHKPENCCSFRVCIENKDNTDNTYHCVVNSVGDLDLYTLGFGPMIEQDLTDLLETTFLVTIGGAK